VGVRGVGGRSAAAKPVAVAGVWGDSKNGPGVFGGSDNAVGVRGESEGASGVSGRTTATNQAGVIGIHASPTGFGIGAIGGSLSPDATAIGVGGIAPQGTGVFGISISAHGVRGVSERASGLVPQNGSGVWGDANGGAGVYGSSNGADGVRGESLGGDGVHGETDSGARAGVSGINKGGGGFRNGVFAHSNSGNGVWAEGRNGLIARAHPQWSNNVAVEGLVFGTNAIAVYGYRDLGAKGGWAGYFYGPVEVAGSLVKTGGGFKIDHPLDPGNKYLNHSFVESNDRKNVYDGLTVLNSRGEAMVGLPAWLEASNRDFRYQLTPIGAPAPDLHVAEGISKGRFRIAGGKPRMRVSWQVTGIRRDAWAEANPMAVEERKTGVERGCYLYPELHGKPEAKAIERVRNAERSERIRDMRSKADELRAKVRRTRPARTVRARRRRSG
jgi:hypothetical protein